MEENREIGAAVSLPPLEEFMAIDPAIAIPQLYFMVKMLLERVHTLEEEVKDLKARLNKDSQNSHKPPSTDTFNKIIKNNREKGQKKQGAQKGHKGTTLQMTSNPDIIITHEVVGECSCGSDLNQAALINTIKQQVIDFPVKLIEVTEHQTEVRQCKCGKVHQGEKLYQGNVPIFDQFGIDKQIKSLFGKTV